MGGLLGGGQRVCWPPSQIIGGGGGGGWSPLPPPPLPTPMMYTKLFIRGIFRCLYSYLSKLQKTSILVAFVLPKLSGNLFFKEISVNFVSPFLLQLLFSLIKDILEICIFSTNISYLYFIIVWARLFKTNDVVR